MSERDKIDRKLDERAVEELSRSNEILESILSNMGDAVIVADKKQKFLVFNPAARQMFGTGATATTAAEWSRRCGLSWPDKGRLCPPEELPLARAMRGERIGDVEMYVRHATPPHNMRSPITSLPLRELTAT